MNSRLASATAIVEIKRINAAGSTANHIGMRKRLFSPCRQNRSDLIIRHFAIRVLQPSKVFSGFRRHKKKKTGARTRLSLPAAQQLTKLAEGL